MQVWLTAFEADPLAEATRVAEWTCHVAGICTLAYLQPIERVATFSLIKYFILKNIISTDGDVNEGMVLPQNWSEPYEAHVQREGRLLRTLAVALTSSE
jgi:hypothetical protein